MRWLKYILLLFLCDAIADVYAEEWLLKHGLWRVAVSWIIYSIGTAFWLKSMQYGSELGRGALMYSVAVAIMGVAIGLYYGEQLTTTRIVGGVLGLISMGLLLK